MDVFVDRVTLAVVEEVLFGHGEVWMASHMAMDDRVSVFGGLYGRCTVRVAMRCCVMHMSIVVVIACSLLWPRSSAADIISMHKQATMCRYCPRTSSLVFSSSNPLCPVRRI
ncbi:hypothetical protein VPH35_017379 [Triticum aestivum]|uniref:Uncharacterized protein n=1 Tax=Aegilops tauschii subsp. strangulata TaxID=200361 RepID=A0A453A1G8_AEGTS